MDLILLILAIVYLAGRGTIARQDPKEHPDVPPDEFARWKRYELRSRDIIIWIGFGWFAAEILILVPLVMLGSGETLNYICPVILMAVPVMLIAIVVSAVFGSKAKGIKNKFNIVPK